MNDRARVTANEEGNEKERDEERVTAPEQTVGKHMINYNECFCNFFRGSCHRRFFLSLFLFV